WEGYTVKALGQATGRKVAQPFGPAVTARLCGSGGLRHCGPALDAALKATYKALVKANGGSANVASWTQDANTVATGLTMPAYDAIGFRALGIVGQPSIPWQNRPPFQRVVSSPAPRPRCPTSGEPAGDQPPGHHRRGGVGIQHVAVFWPGVGFAGELGRRSQPAVAHA